MNLSLYRIQNLPMYKLIELPLLVISMICLCKNMLGLNCMLLSAPLSYHMLQMDHSLFHLHSMEPGLSRSDSCSHNSRKSFHMEVYRLFHCSLLRHKLLHFLCLKCHLRNVDLRLSRLDNLCRNIRMSGSKELRTVLRLLLPYHILRIRLR